MRCGETRRRPERVKKRTPAPHGPAPKFKSKMPLSAAALQQQVDLLASLLRAAESELQRKDEQLDITSSMLGAAPG